MRPHSLVRLAESVYNRPHLITPASLDVVLDYLDARNAGVTLKLDSTASDDAESTASIEGSVGLVAVDGSLTYKPVMTMCGEVGTSYRSLVRDFAELAAVGVKTIVMEVSSGGGEASHVFEAANEIRSICDENDIQLIGYADTVACSAAYALICVCDVVIANPSAELGSIGAVVALTDISKALDGAGIKRIFISSGSEKVPFAENGSFKPEFLEAIQADVNRLGAEFAAHVSKYTSLPVEDILAMNADVYHAEEAKRRKLCDAVMTSTEFAQYVAAVSKGSK